MRRLGSLTAAAAAVLAAASLAAQSSLPSIPPPPTRYFSDGAGLVDGAAAERLNQKLRQFDEQTSTQIVVAVMPELPWPSLEDFTARTAEAWKVGRKQLDNGAILFVFVKDRAVRIEVGYGLEGALPDATAKRIIDEVIVPAFREGRYAEGIEAGADAMMAATRGEYTAPARTARRTGGGRSILLVVVVLLLLNLWIGRRMSRGRYATYSRRGRRRGWGGPIIWGGGGGWGGGGFGGGGGGGFGGGGFSGGGGSFGGGGASGSW